MSLQQNSNKATLLLADGTAFEGKALGAQGTAMGEVVFTTSAVGYQEAMTDPGYWGQMLVQTFPLIGNYGINTEDYESAHACIAGYIVREACEEPSNFRSSKTLATFLQEEGVVGICDLDTRALTIHLRENGTMNGAIVTGELPDTAALLAQIKAYQPEKLLTEHPVAAHTYAACGEKQGELALYDLGCARSIVREFTALGYEVNAVPYDTPLQAVLAKKPLGVVIAGGTGNPEAYEAFAATLKPLLCGKTPAMGIGLGHQLLAMAAGCKTLALHHGHRGSQPVMDLELDKTFVTAQNHGYAVDSATADPAQCTVFCHNLNDKTCEGLRYCNAPAFSIQFHPECYTGTGNTHYYISRFVEMLQSAGGKR